MLRYQAAPPQRATGGQQFPTYIWPLSHALHDRQVLVNYVDHDPGGAVADYEGLTHAYNGHNGTDIMLFNFHDMDAGIAIIAAAGGLVTSVVHHRNDRNTSSPGPDDGNYVIVRSNDTSYHWYWHLRKASATVKVGETVSQGDTLGLVGSSGSSTDAHLHFETGEYVSTVWNVRDPWNGPNNSLPSLWASQEPYVGTTPLRIYDADVFTETAAGGNITSIPIVLLKERMSAPAVMGAGEPYLGIWLQFQGNSDGYAIRIRRPDSSVYTSTGNTLFGRVRYGWHTWYWNFSGLVAPSDYGTWTVEFEQADIVVKTLSFEVDATTTYRPRFWPLAGRSLRLTGGEVRDTLRTDGMSGAVTFSLVGTPSVVSLVDDSIVVVATPSTMTYRAEYFYALATDGSGRSDTMWYQLVDESRPVVCYVDADSDGYGDADGTATAGPGGVCGIGRVANNFDCDDTDAGIRPGVIEVCDGVDDNCNGIIDDGALMVFFLDSDDDGYGDNGQWELGCTPSPGYVTDNTDCDDTDASVNPAATEICNGVDDNCDAQVDEGFAPVTYYADTDGDGYGDHNNSQASCSLLTGYVLDNTDCNDADAGIYPGATEVCNGADDNCDAQIDEGLTSNTYYLDADGDGYGDAGQTQLACSAPSGYVGDDTDCDDSDGEVYPGAIEYCNGTDDDCNAIIDDACIDLCPIVWTGDVNVDELITSADIIYMVNFVFKGDAAPQPCDASGDVDCSGAVTSADIIMMVNHVFKGAAAPCDVCTLVPNTWSCP